MEENTHLNKAIVYLKLLGISFYSIQKAFRQSDKRNIVRKFDNFKDKYFDEFKQKVEEIKINPKKYYE